MRILPVIRPDEEIVPFQYQVVLAVLPAFLPENELPLTVSVKLTLITCPGRKLLELGHETIVHSIV